MSYEKFKNWLHTSKYKQVIRTNTNQDQMMLDAWNACLEMQAQAQQESQWIRVEERLPEVEPQDYELFLVSVFSEQTGKTYVFEAGYLNKLEVMSHDTDYTDFTGWYTRSEHPDYDGWYEPIEGDGCKRRVTHWMIKPLPPAPEGDK